MFPVASAAARLKGGVGRQLKRRESFRGICVDVDGGKEGVPMTVHTAMHQIFTAQCHGTEPYLHIGKVAEISGASCKAIRHYESLGLIPVPQRQGKYRIYSEQDVFLIHMIKHAQLVGFSLKELKALVAAKVSDTRFPLKLANDLFDAKRTTLRNEIAALQELDQRLVALKEDMNRIFGGQRSRPLDSPPKGKV